MAKPRLLFYLKPEVLEVYSDQSDGAARLDFLPEIINHQEVLDAEKYSQSLEEFFSQMGIADLEVVILIAMPLLYLKEFPYEQSTTAEDPNKPLLDYNALNTKIQKFIEETPFDNNQIAKIELKGEVSSLVLVTNKLLYQIIVDVAQKLQARVLAVVPITVFEDLTLKSSLESDDVGLVFASRKNLQQNNFLLSQLSTQSVTKTIAVENDGDEEMEEDGGKKNKLLLIFGIIFIVGGLLVLVLMLGLVKNPLAKPQTETQSAQSSPQPNAVVSVATESAVMVGSQSAALKETKKDQLKVNVINGSGVSGQGSKVKTILTNLGYKDINIAGTSLSGTTDTLVSFSLKVPSSSKDEVVIEMGKSFLNIKPNIASDSAKFDIEVTTGVYK